MYGLDVEEMQLLQDIFSKADRLEEAVLYGSRAKGTNKPFSDIDITLKGEDLSEDDLTNITSQLSESLLPYFCDVSIFHQLKSSSLVDHIRRRGKSIYKK